MSVWRSGLFSDAGSGAKVEASTEATTKKEHTGGSSDGARDKDEAPASSGWGLFGGFVKTIGKVSGEVLQSYKQDLSEFADGLKKESEILSEVTVHAMKDFPHTLETGAVVAQESLESVGQSLEEFGGTIWKGTSELISTVKEAVQMVDQEAAANSKGKPSLSRELSAAQVTSWKYSRYETQVNAMQGDSSTYCDEPEDEEDYAAWRSSFNLSEKKSDTEVLLKETAFMQELEARIVPLVVDYENFWTRYYYRLHKLQQAEDARADLVKRATTSAEEEELSWDVEEEAEAEGQEARANAEGGRHDDDGDAHHPRGGVAAADDDIVPTNQKVHTVPVGQESSGASSSSGEDTRKAEHGEISPTAEQQQCHAGGGGVHDEESISEGSTGSDWLVIPEDNQGVVDTPDKTAASSSSSSSSPTEKEAMPVVLAKRRTVEAEEPEMEEIDELPVEDTTSKDKQSESCKPKLVVDKKPVAEEPEDWGDWE